MLASTVLVGELFGGKKMRMKTRVTKQLAAEQARFILQHPELFREVKPIQPVKVEPEYLPTAPVAWGSMPGQSSLGNG